MLTEGRVEDMNMARSNMASMTSSLNISWAHLPLDERLQTLKIVHECIYLNSFGYLSWKPLHTRKPVVNMIMHL